MGSTSTGRRVLAIVAALVGEADAPHYGALLFSGAHGIAELEISGHLTEEKWRTTAEGLIATLVAMTGDHRSPTRRRPTSPAKRRPRTPPDLNGNGFEG